MNEGFHFVHGNQKKGNSCEKKAVGVESLMSDPFLYSKSLRAHARP